MSTPKPFVPRPYQREGIDFLLTQNAHLLAFDMRLGKTSTAIWATLERGGLPCLIACPANAVGVWEREIELLVPGALISILSHRNFNIAPWTIVGLELAARNKDVAETLRLREWRTLIMDEAHACGGATTELTQAWLTGDKAIARRSEKLWYLTGTPTPSHAGQLWPLMHATGHAPEPARSFMERYCTHKMIEVGSGRNMKRMRVVSGTNLARTTELRARLSGWWLRRKRADVMPDLPPKTSRVVPLPVAALDPTVLAFETSAAGLELREQIAFGDLSSRHTDSSLSEYRRLLSVAKGAAAARYTMDILEGEQAVVLWFWHVDGMDAAEQYLRSQNITTARIDGSVPQGRARTAQTDAFQQGRAKVFLGQIQAAGVAISLSRAGYAIMAEASWIPGHNVQAEDRIVSPEQSGCQIDYLAVRGSLDLAVVRAAERRARETEALMAQS